MVNPHSDTRICAGDPDTEIRGLLVGIDMEVGEVGGRRDHSVRIAHGARETLAWAPTN